MTPSLGAVEQDRDFTVAQKILTALMGIRSGARHTFYISPACSDSRARHQRLFAAGSRRRRTWRRGDGRRRHRSRERQRARKAAKLAAERDDAAGADIAAYSPEKEQRQRDALDPGWRPHFIIALRRSRRGFSSAGAPQCLGPNPPALIAWISATCATDTHSQSINLDRHANPVISISLVQNIRQVTNTSSSTGSSVQPAGTLLFDVINT
jgi:hypothetical protein